MNLLTKLFAITAIVFSTGCASTYNIQAQPKEGQVSKLNDGSEQVLSEKTHIVSVSPVSQRVQSDRRISLIVSIANTSSSKLYVGPELMRASIGSREATVLSHEQLVEEAEGAARSKRIGAALQAFSASLNANAAATTNYSGTYQNNYYGSQSGYLGNSTGSFYGQSYNAAQAAQIREQANQNSAIQMRQASEEEANTLSHLQKTAFKKHELSPGEMYTKIVTLQPARNLDGSLPMTFEIDLNGELHQFDFSLNPKK